MDVATVSHTDIAVLRIEAMMFPTIHKIKSEITTVEISPWHLLLCQH